MTKISVVCPCYNESGNLSILRKSIANELNNMNVEWELIIVDDHSTDSTPTELAKLIKEDRSVTAIRLARNFGSHLAIFCGLEFVSGDCVIVMAADLEDPPETIPKLFEQWKKGRKVVWAARAIRRDKGHIYHFFARIFYRFSRSVLGLTGLPESGADFFLMDSSILKSVQKYREKHINIFALIAWLECDSAIVNYTKEKRLYGKSGWNNTKRFKLIIDTITRFSSLPIRIMSRIGFISAFAGFVYGLEVLRSAFYGEPPEGWASLTIIVLFIGGIQMMMLGMLGEYLWRTLEESRSSPRYVIESIIGNGSKNSSG